MAVVFNYLSLFVNRLFQKRLTFNADVRDATASKSASNKPSPRSNSKKNAITGGMTSYGADFLPITAGVGSGGTAGTGPGSGSVAMGPQANNDNSFVVQVSAENFKGATAHSDRPTAQH